jgi:hypothetical protein
MSGVNTMNLNSGFKYIPVLNHKLTKGKTVIAKEEYSVF